MCCSSCGNNQFKISIVGVAHCAKCGQLLEIPRRGEPPPRGPGPYPKQPPEPGGPYHPDVKGPTWASAEKEAARPSRKRGNA